MVGEVVLLFSNRRQRRPTGEEMRYDMVWSTGSRLGRGRGELKKGCECSCQCRWLFVYQATKGDRKFSKIWSAGMCKFYIYFAYFAAAHTLWIAMCQNITIWAIPPPRAARAPRWPSTSRRNQVTQRSARRAGSGLGHVGQHQGSGAAMEARWGLLV